MREIGHFNIVYFISSRPQLIERLFKFGENICIASLFQKRSRNTNSKGLTFCIPKVRPWKFAGSWQRRTVVWVMAAYSFEERLCVTDRSCERADLIEAAAHRDETEARDRAVGRFQTDDAAERWGLPYRAARVASESSESHLAHNGGRRAPRGAARNARSVKRVLRRTGCGILRRAAHGELVAICAAQKYGAVLFHLLDDGGVVPSALGFK